MFRPNLLATTSFDGSIATTFKRTVTDGVRQHPGLALSERGQQYKVKHSRYSTPSSRRPGGPGGGAHPRATTSPRSSSPRQHRHRQQWRASSTPTSPSTTARVTLLEGRSRTLATRKRGELENLYRHDTGPRPGPAPPSVSFRRPTPGRTTTPPSAEPPGPSGTSPTPSTAPRPPTTGLPSRSSWPWSQPPDTIGPPGSSRSGGFGHFSPFIETAGHPLGMGVRWSALSRLAAAVMHTPRTPSSGSV